ncbi:5-deoxyglucuronate isomerase [Thermomonospora echinospora]|uniref:5-deoxyglucuronate isomerase n=1 Tax=Thermomonospora echinospora TaxID=1992 RepID=A0A1H5X5P5_9ACTN|nr:5-deoxyglucuronate isomerase [Thermomonospora echinospora]
MLDLGPGGSRTFPTGDAELLVLPLAGSCTVTVDDETFEVEGRDSVFSRVGDFVYAPRDARVTVSTAAGGRFALPSARCENRLRPRYGPAEDVPVELRGAGQASRQVNNFCTPEAFPHADRLIACEVLTPAGNWSSYPPHKHDEDRPGECVLEEIYYFEIAAGPSGPGIGYQRVYGTGERPIDVLAEVRTGDTVLIPHGWHGPSMAAPGYDMYYLNVMAGPSAERAWLICDDPAHSWVRATWEGQPVDPRLPMTSAKGVEGTR